MLSSEVSCASLRVSSTTQPAAASDADTLALGLFARDGAGEPALPADAPAELAALISSGEARGSSGSLALAHVDGRRWLLVGLGAQADFSAEKARVAAARVRERARDLACRRLCWLTPLDAEGDAGAGGDASAIAAALVEGTILADYSFDRFKSSDPDGAPAKHLDELIVAAPVDLTETVARAAVVAGAANAARDLQNRPANDLTPAALGEYARALAGQDDRLSVAVEGRDGLLARSMGAFAAVAQGSAQEPALIVLRYEPPGGGAGGTPVLGIVGKAVTFDSGGISLKPGAKMAEMKFDMSGGAAALEATAAIAKLGLPLKVIAVVGATENLPSGTSMKPGDIVTASNGKTIEINNTDAEGRLVLADCLCHAVALGAERIVDLATLTGAVIVALGSTHAGLLANDDELSRRVEQAGQRAGEIVWRLPMHEEYDELVKGTYADLDNAPEGRKAGTIVGASFLANFVGDTPWAHLDIAGSAWDLGRAYAKKHASGYGVRLLVELARSYCP